LDSRVNILNYLHALEESLHQLPQSSTSPEVYLNFTNNMINKIRSLVMKGQFTIDAYEADRYYDDFCSIPCVIRADQEFLILQPLQEITDEEFAALANVMTTARETAGTPTDRPVVLLPYSVKFLRAKIHLPEKE